jgi:histidinol-phosphate aminotransferase
MRTFDLNAIIRPNIRALRPYRSARDDFRGKASLYLDANENPFPSSYHRYPDARQHALRLAVSTLKKITLEQTLLTHGSDEAIDLIIRAFCRPQIDNVIIPQPTYGMYATFAAINDVGIREIPLTPGFALDREAVFKAIDSNSRIIFLCCPNNPTGNLFKAADIRAMLNKFQGLLVIDEAYIDFSTSRSWINDLGKYPNLVVLQTFSKSWGLAGIRAGICLTDPSIIQVLEKIKPPYYLSTAAEQAILYAVRRQHKRMLRQVELLRNEREKLSKALKALPVVRNVYPSQGNFLLVRVTDARAVYEALLDRGIVVRLRSGVNCDNCLRITLGTPSQNKRLLTVLKSL